MSEDLIVPAELALLHAPEHVIAQAQAAAKALMRVVAQKPNPVMFNGVRYIDFNDYQTLGRMFGLGAKVVHTESTEHNGASGFLARAVVIDARTGLEVGGAEAMCLNDEDNWSTRTKYEWHYVCKDGRVQAEDPGSDQIVWEKSGAKNRPKKKRVKVGAVPVPAFQLRSMAQTRACAKALRGLLGFVPVMAGFSATPAEEVTGDEEPDRPAAPAPVQPPQRKSAAKPAPTKTETPTADSDGTVEGLIQSVNVSHGETPKGPWTRYSIQIEGHTLSTFSDTDGAAAIDAQATDRPVRCVYKIQGRYKNLVALEVLGDAAEPVPTSDAPDGWPDLGDEGLRPGEVPL